MMLTHDYLGSTLENTNKNFHFQEIDLIVYFPGFGNERKKYADYCVTFENRKKVSSKEKLIDLGEVLECPEIENNYPHTVGFYKVSSGEGPNLRPAYLEIRKIQNAEEFWKFLNDLDM